MKRQLISLALGITGALCASQAMARDTIVQFTRGIGVDPVAGIAAGAPVLNTVLTIAPGGRPWVIHTLRATVYADGTINARGTGLVLAGGDTIGTRAGITSVVATLFCDKVPFTSAPADLDTAGNFTIRGSLGAVPNPCGAPVLLIRNGAGGGGAWFAAGIPGSDDD
jgi:hypothetical protein